MAMPDADIETLEKDDDRPRMVAIRLLGTRIVAGGPGYWPGDVLPLSQVMEQIGGSRALAREVLQALQHKGLVTLRTRVGATVQPVQNWNVFDADVIDWRLAAAPRFPMREMTEVRQAVEPRAAFLAAQRASADVCRNLVNLAVELKALAEDRRFTQVDEAGAVCREQFRTVDAALHAAILEGSNNEMFRALSVAVESALDFRIKNDWEGAKREKKWEEMRTGGKSSASRDPGRMKEFPFRPEPLAMWLHYGMVYAIDQGHPQAAETFSRAIIAECHNGQLNDPFLQEALQLALRQLDLSGFAEADRDPFFEAVAAVAYPEPFFPTDG
jgi:DNA-binding FadR family transcriptional regulator